MSHTVPSNHKVLYQNVTLLWVLSSYDTYRNAPVCGSFEVMWLSSELQQGCILILVNQSFIFTRITGICNVHIACILRSSGKWLSDYSLFQYYNINRWIPASGHHNDSRNPYSLFSKETHRLNYQSPNEIQLIAEIAVFFSVLPYLFLTSLTY